MMDLSCRSGGGQWTPRAGAGAASCRRAAAGRPGGVRFAAWRCRRRAARAGTVQQTGTRAGAERWDVLVNQGEEQSRDRRDWGDGTGTEEGRNWDSGAARQAPQIYEQDQRAFEKDRAMCRFFSTCNQAKNFALYQNAIQ